MLVFLWILGAMGVAYAAKLQGRLPWLWFALGLVLTPLGGSVALMAITRRN
jgi:hypothetical protein